MIRTIHLHGALGASFGREIRLDVASPAEAVRALCLMVEGFRAHVERGCYQVFRGRRDRGIDLDPQELHVGFSDIDVELHLVPRAAGAKNRGLGKVLLGGLLIAASFVVPGGWAIAGEAVSGMVAQAGIAMAIGGVAQMLAPQQRQPEETDNGEASTRFGGAVNIATVGVAVPVIVGECEVGSRVVSAAMMVVDRVVEAADDDGSLFSRMHALAESGAVQ